MSLFRIAAANGRAAADSTTMTVTRVDLTIEDDDMAGFAFAREEDPGFGRSRMLDVTEGGSTTYTVALASEPTGDVTVKIPGDADLTVSPPMLTFTAANWETPRTVEAVEDEDNLADITATLTHMGSGGGYAGVAGTVSVAVMGDTVVAVAPGADNDYGIEGRRVTVKAEAGVPEGIELDLKGLGAGGAPHLHPHPERRLGCDRGGGGRRLQPGAGRVADGGGHRRLLPAVVGRARLPSGG